ncbi:unnamed protein product, partial [Oikopleura dioica]
VAILLLHILLLSLASQEHQAISLLRKHLLLCFHQACRPAGPLEQAQVAPLQVLFISQKLYLPAILPFLQFTSQSHQLLLICKEVRTPRQRQTTAQKVIHQLRRTTPRLLQAIHQRHLLTVQLHPIFHRFLLLTALHPARCCHAQ